MCRAPLDDWTNGGYVMSYSRVVSVVLVLFGVGLHTLNFMHSSLSVNQQEILKRIMLVVHT